MKYTFLSLLFRRFELEYSFRIAADYGFDGLEVWGGRPHAYWEDMDNSQIRKINDWKRMYHLEIPMFVPEILSYPYGIASRLESERRAAVSYLQNNVALADKIGAPCMMVTVPHPGYGRKKQECWDQMIDGLGLICQRAETLGVDIVLEALTYHEGGNLLTSVDDLVKAIEEVGSCRLKSMIDLVPPFIANEPISEYFQKLGDCCRYLHLCNSDGISEFHERLGQGLIPLQDCMQIAKRYGYDGWCSIELLTPYFRDPELYLSEAKRYLEQIKP